MDGLTAVEPSDSASPMLAEEPKEHRSGGVNVISMSAMASSVAPDSANSKPVVEQAARHRWPRPVKGQSCGAHVVAQLQNSSTLPVATGVSSKNARECEQAGAAENCTPLQLARATSDVEACKSAIVSAKPAHTSSIEHSTVSNQECGHPTPMLHRSTGASVRRRNSRSLGAAMVASFAPQPTQHVPCTSADLGGQPAGDPSVHATGPRQPLQTGNETDNSQTESDPASECPRLSALHTATASPPAGEVRAVAELGEPTQAEPADIDAGGICASITTAAAVATEQCMRPQGPVQCQQRAAVHPVCVRPPSGAVAEAADQEHATVPNVSLSTATTQQLQRMKAETPAESSGHEPGALHTLDSDTPAPQQVLAMPVSTGVCAADNNHVADPAVATDSRGAGHCAPVTPAEPPAQVLAGATDADNPAAATAGVVADVDKAAALQLGVYIVTLYFCTSDWHSPCVAGYQRLCFSEAKREYALRCPALPRQVYVTVAFT